MQLMFVTFVILKVTVYIAFIVTAFEHTGEGIVFEVCRKLFQTYV